MTKFTKEEIVNWNHYEEVRLSGEYNMIDPRAREIVGLTRSEYSFVMNNYSELKEASSVHSN